MQNNKARPPCDSLSCNMERLKVFQQADKEALQELKETLATLAPKKIERRSGSLRISLKARL